MFIFLKSMVFNAHIIFFAGVEFPANPASVKKIEKLNDVRINVFRINASNKIFPYCISAHREDDPEFDNQRIIDVLELCSSRGNHFAWIRSLTAALRRQI